MQHPGFPIVCSLASPGGLCKQCLPAAGRHPRHYAVRGIRRRRSCEQADPLGRNPDRDPSSQGAYGARADRPPIGQLRPPPHRSRANRAFHHHPPGIPGYHRLSDRSPGQRHRPHHRDPEGRLGNADYGFPLMESYKVHLWPDQQTRGNYSRPWINIGVGGRSGDVFGGVGVVF